LFLRAFFANKHNTTAEVWDVSAQCAFVWGPSFLAVVIYGIFGFGFKIRRGRPGLFAVEVFT
jgi:hypothetical protein